MAKQKIDYQGVDMTEAAADCAEEAGVDVQMDVLLLIDGDITAEKLLEDCLEGADPDRIQGWHEYVTAVAHYAVINKP